MEILLFEDDIIWQQKTIAVLNSIGRTNICIAKNKDEVIEKLKKYSIDFIIANIKNDDFQTIDFISKFELPTIFITSFGKEEYIMEINKNDLTFLLEKPLQKFTLSFCIANLIKRSFEQHENKKNEYNTNHVKLFLNTLQKTKILDLLNFNENDKKLLELKWFGNKSFREIGDDLDISSQKVLTKYNGILRKLKTKMNWTAKALDEYFEFKKVRYNSENLKKLKKGELKFLEIENHNIHIDELVEIPTKYRNILKVKGVVRLGDLQQYTFRQLALTKHLGIGSAKIIEETMGKFGLKLKE